MSPATGVFPFPVRFSVVPVRLVERLHVDLCRLNGALCR
ncbi:putative leader peptide [Planomonospora corallina]|uniref:Leader peptide n=1 Tax=Planomonospora corallina TaxID=1806052 RepID=A0ABV8I7B4_9ACTN